MPNCASFRCAARRKSNAFARRFCLVWGKNGGRARQAGSFPLLGATAPAALCLRLVWLVVIPAAAPILAR